MREPLQFGQCSGRISLVFLFKNELSASLTYKGCLQDVRIDRCRGRQR